MATLVIRLAGPVQTWASYRVSYTRTPTAPVPTKSGVAGLIGACSGIKDYRRLIPTFDLYVRVDRTNPVVTDLQVASSTKEPEKEGFRRSRTLAAGKVSDAMSTLVGTAFPGLAERDFIPHAEFICALEAPVAQVQEWLAAFKDPAFMPYLGRRANAPAFPVLLGTTPGSARDVLTALPRVLRPGDHADTRMHQVTGDYANHASAITSITPPTTTSRREQLAWASSHLNR